MRFLLFEELIVRSKEGETLAEKVEVKQIDIPDELLEEIKRNIEEKFK